VQASGERKELNLTQRSDRAPSLCLRAQEAGGIAWDFLYGEPPMLKKTGGVRKEKILSSRVWAAMGEEDQA